LGSIDKISTHFSRSFVPSAKAAFNRYRTRLGVLDLKLMKTSD